MRSAKHPMGGGLAPRRSRRTATHFSHTLIASLRCGSLRADDVHQQMTAERWLANERDLIERAAALGEPWISPRTRSFCHNHERNIGRLRQAMDRATKRQTAHAHSLLVVVERPHCTRTRKAAYRQSDFATGSELVREDVDRQTNDARTRLRPVVVDLQHGRQRRSDRTQSVPDQRRDARQDQPRNHDLGSWRDRRTSRHGATRTIQSAGLDFGMVGPAIWRTDRASAQRHRRRLRSDLGEPGRCSSAKC